MLSELLVNRLISNHLTSSSHLKLPLVSTSKRTFISALNIVVPKFSEMPLGHYKFFPGFEFNDNFGVLTNF